MTTPLGVGIVGLSASGGWAAATHVPALAHVDGVELRCLTASSSESSAASAAVFGVRAHPDVARLVGDPDIDLVVVAVKAPDHARVVRAALLADKAVYCEWPLARSVSEAEELAALAAEVGSPLLVGLQGRSSPVLGGVRDLVADGYVGEPLMVSVDAAGLMGGPVIPARSRYQLDPVNGATVLTIPVGHLLDNLQLVLGPLTDLRATAVVGRPVVEIRETGERVPSSSVSHVAIAGRVGSRGVLSLACHGGTRPPPGLAWRILGSEGELSIHGDLGHPQMAELTVRGARGSSESETLIEPGDVPHAITCLAAVYAAMPDALAGRATGVPDATDAVRLHRLLDGLVR